MISLIQAVVRIRWITKGPISIVRIPNSGDLRHIGYVGV